MVDSYDLASVIAGLDKSQKKSIWEKIFCLKTSDITGHAGIAREVDIQYKKQVK